MVAFSFPQRHCRRWRGRSRPPLRHVSARMGARDGSSGAVMDHHSLLSVADGGDARDGCGKAV